MENKIKAMDFIDSFTKRGTPVEDLSRIAFLLRILENPQKSLKFIHIAGTNGKGSTLEFISSMLIAGGYKTGQFTSPFMTRYNDRIRIDGSEIDDESLMQICKIVKAATLGGDYSQFEISLACALLYFKQENCDIVCLETGIGGKLDATNVIENPLVSVVTSISFDHTDILGDTIEEIALQKLGIVKENSPLILSTDNPCEVRELAEKITSEKNSEVIQPNLEKLKVIDAQRNEFEYKDCLYSLKMAGKHQICNALTAIETIKVIKNLGFDLSLADMQEGLKTANVCSRLEIVSQNPLIILDGAHNPSAMEVLRDFIQSLDKSVTVVVGMLDTKDVHKSVEIISSVVENVVCTDGYHPNNIKSERLCELFRGQSRCAIPSDLQGAIDRARAFNSEVVVVCGSLYLTSEIRRMMK